MPSIYISSPKAKLTQVRQINSDKPARCFIRHSQGGPNHICSICYDYRHSILAPYGRKQATHMNQLYQANRHELENIGQGISQPPCLKYYKAKLFRFNGFGELHSENHLIGLIAIAKANPQKTFALYSKEIDRFSSSFIGLSANLAVVQSAPIIDRIPAPVSFAFDGVSFQPNTIFCTSRDPYILLSKIKDEGLDHSPVHCSKKQCYKCQFCYQKHHTTRYVVEKIK